MILIALKDTTSDWVGHWSASCTGELRKHTRSTSWLVLSAGVNVMKKWGVRTVSFILTTLRISILRASGFLSKERHR